MADAKKKKVGPKKPTAPFIGYGTNVAAGKAITKSVAKKVKKELTTVPFKDGVRAGQIWKKTNATKPEFNATRTKLKDNVWFNGVKPNSPYAKAWDKGFAEGYKSAKNMKKK